jgi:multiple sugar transport system ATP-binding protein
MLDIGALLDRYPRQLSGGQRQRVAIGRAIVRNVPLFLFDEPLSNLDAQLRDEMRGEIKRLHQELGTTMIYVTHDQIEAMTLADQVVLMRDGLIEQQGAPLDLFERPATRFVAGFLGSPQMNFLAGSVVRSGEGDAIRLPGEGTVAPLPMNRLDRQVADGAKVILGIRPEHMTRATQAAPPPGVLRYEATIDLLQPTGSRTFATFTLGGAPIVAELQAHDVSRPGERTAIDINLQRAAIFDATTERAL